MHFYSKIYTELKGLSYDINKKGLVTYCETLIVPVTRREDGWCSLLWIIHYVTLFASFTAPCDET